MELKDGAQTSGFWFRERCHCCSREPRRRYSLGRHQKDEFEVSVEQPTGDDQRAFEFRSLKHKRVLPLEIQTWDLSEYGS